jgi:phi13 family phage major tail protein
LAKKAIHGFAGATLFPVLENSPELYTVGEAFRLPHVQEMTKEADVSSAKIYADDMLYLNNKNFNGYNVTITVAEMTLENMARLGFGEFDEESGVLTFDPQGTNPQFGLTFRCLRADGQYRMMRMYCFTVNEIKESGMKTKGDGGDIHAYQITGTFTYRHKDMRIGEIRDGADLSWLGSMETPDSAESGQAGA